MLVELTAHPDRVGLTDATPDFAWIVNAPGLNEVQTAYRILVSSSKSLLDTGAGDMWDSGKTVSNASVSVSYAGKALAPNATYQWKVQTWNGNDVASAWSSPQAFTMAGNLSSYSTPAPPVDQTAVPPTTMTQVDAGRYFLDFGRAAFGWLELTFNASSSGTMSVSLGEKASGQSVNASPGGSIRAEKVSVAFQAGQRTYRVQAPNNGGTIAIPASLGVVMPFRYVEVSGAPVALTKDTARQIAVAYPFDDGAASFTSSSANLDKVWELSKHSIVATTFADIYVDGDRERKPYEADAYIQQLGHYGIDRDYALARKSHEYLMTNPTWPTEWKFHSIMMAWADWMYTGNLESLSKQYAALKQSKTLESNVNADGLLNTGSLMDIVDWPETERDGYVLTPVNTVVNSFWCYVLGLMADLANALGNSADATRYRNMATTATAALNAKLVNASTGLYVDGQTSAHSSLHANMFPLAFHLVPADRQAKVTSFVVSRGMACSVYGAQYLLEGLFSAGQADAAISLLTATNDRSWMNMLAVGSTITLEAWDAKYKPNLDWNHAWGAAPANILPRYILGVRPASPGFGKAIIAPQPGSLGHVEGTVPTIRGPIQVSVATQPPGLTVTIPANMTADLAIPASAMGCTPLLDDQLVNGSVSGGATWVASVGSGRHTVRCR
jgi:alpha-L-rhamnosidase